MGVYTFTTFERTSPIAPARLFKALCLDNHNVLPKVLPDVIKSIDFVEGNTTSVGCVKQFNFAEGAPYKYVKDKVNELDVNNHYVKFTNIEGDALGDKLDHVVYEVKMTPSGSGTHYKMIAHYHTKGDAVITETDPIFQAAKESMLKMYNAVVEHLSKNPNACA